MTGCVPKCAVQRVGGKRSQLFADETVKAVGVCVGPGDDPAIDDPVEKSGIGARTGNLKCLYHAVGLAHKSDTWECDACSNESCHVAPIVDRVRLIVSKTCIRPIRMSQESWVYGSGLLRIVDADYLPSVVDISGVVDSVPGNMRGTT
jgi:hypothetical protein